MKLNKRFEIRLTKADRLLVKKAAEARGWKTGMFIREAAVAAARRQLERQLAQQG